MGVHASEQVTSATLGLAPPLLELKKNKIVGFRSFPVVVRKEHSLSTTQMHRIVGGEVLLPGMNFFML